jgi:hypothetical protein
MRKPSRAAKANGIQAPASTALNAVDPQTASSGRSTTRRIKIFIAEARSAAPSNGFLGAARSVNFLRTILERAWVARPMPISFANWQRKYWSSPPPVEAVRPRQGVSTSRNGAAHIAFERIKTLGPCDI